jgi:succinate dehydrogenase / fumarate reductase membrane anchor subunit
MRISNGYGPRPASGGFEAFSWYFIRVSGIALIFLVIIHLLVMHVTTDVACTTFQFVASRYANPLWRLFDWLLLTLALLHGMNGLRVVMDDYVPSRTWRIRILSVLGILTLAFFMLGTITIIAFQNVPASLLGPHCVQFH